MKYLKATRKKLIHVCRAVDDTFQPICGAKDFKKEGKKVGTDCLDCRKIFFELLSRVQMARAKLAEVYSYGAIEQTPDADRALRIFIKAIKKENTF